MMITALGVEDDSLVVTFPRPQTRAPGIWPPPHRPASAIGGYRLPCLFTHSGVYNEGMTLDRITIDSALMNGQPCVRGMRLTVRRVVEAVALYPDRSQLRAEYPELEEEDIRQALAYAAASLDDRVLELRVAS